MDDTTSQTEAQKTGKYEGTDSEKTCQQAQQLMRIIYQYCTLDSRKKLNVLKARFSLLKWKKTAPLQLYATVPSHC